MCNNVITIYRKRSALLENMAGPLDFKSSNINDPYLKAIGLGPQNWDIFIWVITRKNGLALIIYGLSIVKKIFLWNPWFTLYSLLNWTKFYLQFSDECRKKQSQDNTEESLYLLERIASTSKPQPKTVELVCFRTVCHCIYQKCYSTSSLFKEYIVYVMVVIIHSFN